MADLLSKIVIVIRGKVSAVNLKIFLNMHFKLELVSVELTKENVRIDLSATGIYNIVVGLMSKHLKKQTYFHRDNVGQLNQIKSRREAMHSLVFHQFIRLFILEYCVAGIHI